MNNPLWYETEIEKKKKDAEINQITRKISDYTVDNPIGHWEFVSNLRSLRVVMKPSYRKVDQTGIVDYQSGKTIAFNMGRFITNDPEVVDYLLSQRDYGTTFITAFDVKAYKEWRLKNLGYDVPVEAEDDFEEFLSDSNEEVYGGTSEPETKIHIPTADEVDTFTALTNGPDRMDILESKLEALVDVVTALAGKAEAKESDSELFEKSEVKPKRTFKCRDCDMTGFASPQKVVEHKRSGECKKMQIKKMKAMIAADQPRVSTGMQTAGPSISN